MTALDDLKTKVSEVVEEWLSGYSPRRSTQPKIIRDPVTGFENLRAHEVAIVDSPVFQRLRYIHQTALAYQVYPGAHHTRFEHSLGAAHRAEQMMRSLGDRRKDLISPEDIVEVRLAALLHDVGHGPFSHLSESIFSERFSAELKAIEMEDEKFRGRGLGEVLSYLIITSGPFQEFFEDIRTYHHLQEIKLEKIANYFLGYADESSSQFMAEIISGPFDADKLDYFHRDCYYTGIRAEIDIERILAVVDIDARSTAPSRHLVIHRAGVHHMEHIIFSKMLLFSSVYHHHKIRALECGLRSVFRRIWQDPSRIDNLDLRFPDIASMLRVTDGEFWALARRETELRIAVDALSRGRNLPMRSLALSMPTIDLTATNPDSALKFQKLNQFPERQREIGDTIYNMLPAKHQGTNYGVWFDFPQSPKVAKDAHDTVVDRGDEYVRLEEFFPTPQWVAAYIDNKLTAHVFYDGDDEQRRAAAEKGLEYFAAEPHGIVCKDLAMRICFKDDEW